jgi:hypothetical protein
MSSESKPFATFDAAIGKLAGSYVHRAGPGDLSLGDEPLTLMPRAGWAARVVLGLALERSLLVPVASDGPPRASPPELAVYGGFVHCLAQGFRHHGWAERQKVDLDAVVREVLDRHGCLLGVGQTMSLPAMGHTRYRTLRRRALERPPLRQALRASADGFEAWVVDPTDGATQWLAVLYRYFCAHVGVDPMLALAPAVVPAPLRLADTSPPELPVAPSAPQARAPRGPHA